MLDTVILRMKKGTYQVTDWMKFGIRSEEDFVKISGFRRFPNNPTVEDKRNGIYKPRLTLLKRGYDEDLKIEFSVPKLIFKNNLDEIDEENFILVIKTLIFYLREMGVLATEQAIKDSIVSAIHIAKNVQLSSGYSATLAINELSKIDLNQKFDLDKTSFRNSGNSLQYYSIRHSFVIYDKIADLEKPEKRAIDKDRVGNEGSLFEKIEQAKKPLEILRLEVRLSHRQKLSTVLKRLDYENEPSFQGMFNKAIWQKIMLLYWNDFIAEKNLFLFTIGQKPQRTLSNILAANQKIETKRAIYLTGLNQLCKDDGIRNLRSVIYAHRPKTAWSKFKKDLDMLRKADIGASYDFISDIKKSLDTFAPFRLKNYQLDV